MKSAPKKLWRILCLIAAILAGLWLIIHKLLPILVPRSITSEASSIGIIGGADGPTAIFVTSQPSNLWTWLIPAAFLIAAAVGLFWLNHKNKGEA